MHLHVGVSLQSQLATREIAAVSEQARSHVISGTCVLLAERAVHTLGTLQLTLGLCQVSV